MEQHRVIRSAFIVGAFTSLSRLLGLLREILTAGMFGTSAIMSAFVLAYRIPNLFRRLFGEGALSSAFVSVFMEARKSDGEEVAHELARRVLSLASVALILLSIIGIAAAGFLISEEKAGTNHALSLTLTRIMLPYMFFICLAALMAAVSNAYHHFAVPALSSSVMNLTWIATVIFLCPLFGDTVEERSYGLAWGVLLSGFFQLGLQIPLMRRIGFHFRFTWRWNDPRVWQVFLMLGPATLGLAITQINLMVNSLMAAEYIGSWAPAALYYSERLLYLPQGILATAMSTVLLPVFAAHAAEKRNEEMLQTMNRSLRMLTFVMIPAAIGLLIMAEPVIQMLFERGEFTDASTRQTTIALQCYAPGLLIFSLSKVFVPAFYAHKDTKTPFIIGVACVLLNFSLNVLFIVLLSTEVKHAGLAASTVIAEAVNGFVLGWFVHRRMGSPGWLAMVAAAARSLIAALVMAIVLWFGFPWILGAVQDSGLPQKIAQIISVLLIIAAGCGVYFAAAFALRCPELDEALAALRRRRKK